MKTDHFWSCGPCWVFQTCQHIECSIFTALSLRISNSLAGIPSPLLALFIVMIPKVHLTHTPGCLALDEWSHHCGYLGHEDLFSFCVFLSPLLNIFCFCYVHATSVLYCAHLYVKCSLESESEVIQSCPNLCDPMDCSLPGSSLHGIFQARVLEWVAISFSRGSSQTRDRTWVSCIGGRRFNLWATSWRRLPLTSP